MKFAHPLLSLSAALVAGAFLAAPVRAQGPGVINLEAGKALSDGTFLWKYEVSSGRYQDLTFWALGVSKDVFDSIIPHSVSDTPFEWIDRDGFTGIIFSHNLNHNNARTIRFRLDQDFTGVQSLALLKTKGGPLDTERVIAPGGIAVSSTSVPEPGALALCGAGLLPLAAALRRRRP